MMMKWLVAMILLAGPLLAQGTYADTSGTQYGEHVEVRDTILNLVRGYAGLLGLEDWVILVKFRELTDEQGESWSAWTEAMPEYMEAQVDFNLEKLSRKDWDRIHAVVRHEMFHVLLWETLEWFYDFLPFGNELVEEHARRWDERLTTRLERMPVWALLLGAARQ